MTPQALTLVSSILLTGILATSCKKDESSKVNQSNSLTYPVETKPKSKPLALSGIDPIDELSANEKKLLTDAIKYTQAWSKLTNNKLKWRERVEFLQNIDYSALNSEDTELLYKLMKYRAPSSSKRDQEAWFVVANEIMEQMRMHDLDKGKFNTVMLELAHDAGLNPVLRDYSIQHLGLSLLEQEISEEENIEHLKKVINVAEQFTNLIQDSALSRTSVPGTTLRTLVNLKEAYSSSIEIDHEIEKLSPFFSNTLSQLTGEQGYSILTDHQQITAISVINTVGQLGLKDHTKTIRDIAQDVEMDPTLRLNSIATLGMLGEVNEDEAFLTELSPTREGPNARFRFAAQAALNTLKQQ